MNQQVKITSPLEWPSNVDQLTLTRLVDIIANKTNIDRGALTPCATMESLNIPSLDMVDILFGVEEEFNIYIPMGDELSHVVYLHDLVKILADQIRGCTPYSASKA